MDVCKVKDKNPREIILDLLLTQKDNKLRLSKIPFKTGLTSSEVSEVISSMKVNNLVSVDRHGRLNINIPKNSITGTIYTAPTGNGFVKGDNGQTYYVPKTFLKTAVHKDRVLISPTYKPAKDKNQEGIVLYVISHEIDTIVGTYIPSENGKFGFVISDDNRVNFDLYIGKKYTNGAKAYDKVVANITKFPDRPGKKPIGEITEVIGLAGDIEVEQESIIKSFGLPEKFPPDVIKESQIFQGDKPENWDLSHRTDFRDKLIITMDCDDTKDLDDAISIERTNDGYELGVYIADVAHYVREGSATDREALKRGNSTYLLNDVIPMLHPVLSNNLCSLNPKEDKLVLAVIMNIDNNGYVKSHKICEGIMQSRTRLNYTEVTKALTVDNSEFITKHGNDIFEMMVISKELSDKLMDNRLQRGSIEFAIPEPEVVLDKEGNCIDIKPEKRGIANDIIEEFMVLTNETVAKFFFEKKIPFIYRIHPTPFKNKLETFRIIAERYGVKCDEIVKDDLTPKELQKLVKKIDETNAPVPLRMLLLQSMKQAKYSEILTPHFGLGSSYYCHFTSPIRRYPDLMIHRIIKMYLKGCFCNSAMNEKYNEICHEAAKQASRTERVSDNAQREVIKNKCLEYISNNMENEYTAVIHSLNKAGMYVTLSNSLTGFIKNKNYSFSPEEIKGYINDKEYNIGDVLTVKASAINKNTREAMFEICVA